MKVLLRKNVFKLGHIGDVVEVKNGYARNYLLPQGLAMQPTEANLRTIEEEKAAYLEEVAKEQAEVKARAKLVSGKEITLRCRANEEGHLYGSVGPAQIVAALAEENIFVEVHDVVLKEPFRMLDKYDVELRFAEEITATIHVWIVPLREEGDEDEPSDTAPAEAPVAAEEEIEPYPENIDEE